MKKIFFFFFIIQFSYIFGKTTHNSHILGGRVSRINISASLVRLRIRSKNIKFINEQMRLEFWGINNAQKRCKGFTLGRSNNYVILKVPHLNKCIRYINLSVGSYIYLTGKDFSNNIEVAKGLTDVLVKKQMAIESLIKKRKKNIQISLDKVEAINNRYEILMDKMQKEWAHELAKMETSRIKDLQDYHKLERKGEENIHKIEKYRIHDDNLQKDRWSLDFRKYYMK